MSSASKFAQLGTRNGTGKALNATITGNALNATITGNALNAMITSNALIARITGDALNATSTGTGNGLDEQQTNELTFSSKIYRLLQQVLGSENNVYGNYQRKFLSYWYYFVYLCTTRSTVG